MRPSPAMCWVRRPRPPADRTRLQGLGHRQTVPSALPALSAADRAACLLA